MAGRIKPWFACLITIGTSLAVGYACYRSGVNGDCKPNEIDGQCGMSTFVGFYGGIIYGFVVFLELGAYFVRAALRERRSKPKSEILESD